MRILGLSKWVVTLLGIVSMNMHGVFAQEAGYGVEPVLDFLKTALLAAQALAWAVIALGIVIGLIQIGTPSGSIMLKRSGRMQVEMSSITAFFVLFGPLLLYIMINLWQAMGSPGWPSPTST